MKRHLAVLLAVAACNRAPELSLPVCSGGVSIDAGVKHSMTIDAKGQVSVNGVSCSTDRELEEALDAAATSMHSNDAVAQRLGFVDAPDEPLLVRIDQSVRFHTAARCLGESRRNRILRMWIAVRDESTGEEPWLAIESLPRDSSAAIADEPDWPVEIDALAAHVQLGLEATAKPSWSKEIERFPAWDVAYWPSQPALVSWKPSSWQELRERVSNIVPRERECALRGALPKDMRWSEVVPIVAEALALWNADIYFGADVDEAEAERR